MKTTFHWLAAVSAIGMVPAPALAAVPGEIVRLDAERVTVTWTDPDPVTILVAEGPDADPATARVVAADRRGGTAIVPLRKSERLYVLLRDGGDGSVARMAERVLPLEQGSNFRDVGGYATVDGRRVRWGKIYRAGAMPLLTEADYAYLAQLKLGTIVDLRSTDERQIAPDLLDDRTGALFVSNDYSLKPLLTGMTGGDGENVYRSMGKALSPQYRSLFKRLLADDGATLYHCSAGQDRTGVATALVLAALGVPRETIVADYHLSTQLRRPQFEMPPINAADWPGNPIVPYYVAHKDRPGGPKAEPLYTPKGNSHLVQFLAQIDQEYGSVEGYLAKELGITADDIDRLKGLYLE